MSATAAPKAIASMPAAATEVEGAGGQVIRAEAEAAAGARAFRQARVLAAVAAAAPAAMKVTVAAMDRREPRALPKMPWPLVQPLPRAVPKPTRRPDKARRPLPPRPRLVTEAGAEPKEAGAYAARTAPDATMPVANAKRSMKSGEFRACSVVRSYARVGGG